MLLRHGESEWNAANLFTGWVDVGLCPTRDGPSRCGPGSCCATEGVLPDVVHTSLLRRAISTAQDALAACDRDWIPVRRSWRLNERHYGDLQGKNKAQVREQYGEDQFMIWRRSYDTPPPPIADDAEFSQAADPRYAGLAPEVVPRSECLKDVVERMLPYWYDAVVPDLRSGATVLVAAHGNSLRALVKHLDGDRRGRDRRPEHPDRDPAALRPGRPAAADAPRRPLPGSGRRRGRDRSGQAPRPLTLKQCHIAPHSARAM